MTGNLPTKLSKRAIDFFGEMQAARARLIFGVDATGSRHHAWDTACQLQAAMFMEAAKTGALEVQLVYYRGLDECRASAWTTDARELASTMSRVTCISGQTQIARIFAHVRKEHAQQEVGAAVFIGDMVEETPETLYDIVVGLPPVFIFQEGNNGHAAGVFKRIAELSKGAYSQFTPGSPRELNELLRAVAAFTVGGQAALADLRTDGARKLLEQLR